jgi:beta-glucuronidase
MCALLLVLFAGVIEYEVDVGGYCAERVTVSVSLLDRDGNYIIRNVEGNQRNLQVPEARLWWPYLMHPDPAYLYTLEVKEIYILLICGD